MTVPIDGTASPDERNAAIARFLFAPDWIAARDLVMSEPWLLSPQADNDLASASARFVEQEKADPNMIPLAGRSRSFASALAGRGSLVPVACSMISLRSTDASAPSAA